MLSLLQSNGSFVLHFNVKASNETGYSTAVDVRSSNDTLYTVGKTVLSANDTPYAVS